MVSGFVATGGPVDIAGVFGGLGRSLTRVRKCYWSREYMLIPVHAPGVCQLAPSHLRGTGYEVILPDNVVPVVWNDGSVEFLPQLGEPSRIGGRQRFH